jgi:hypothetical protein
MIGKQWAVLPYFFGGDTGVPFVAGTGFGAQGKGTWSGEKSEKSISANLSYCDWKNSPL